MSARIRPAVLDDAEAMARVHVRAWQQTYRGLMPDATLDDPDAVDRRIRMWSSILEGSRGVDRRVAVAETDDGIVGIAMTGPPQDEDAPASRVLYVLYLLAEQHGSGAGSELLEAVLDPAESATLWVADPNPRAQAFYRKHGFAPDGAEQVDFDVREIRMTRDAPTEPAAPEGPARG